MIATSSTADSGSHHDRPRIEATSTDPGHRHVHDDLQHYPSSRELAMRLAAMFDLSHLAEGAILDACSAQGCLSEVLPDVINLAKPQQRMLAGRVLLDDEDLRNRALKNVACMDAIEIDVRHHPALRGKGYRIVGLDLATHEALSRYSFVVCNPPFSRGAEFALKLWDGIVAGSIGIVLNAQTLRNPIGPDRQRLVKLIAKHGQVEFVSNAFAPGSCERPARVEVALVRLDKPSAQLYDWLDACIRDLARNVAREDCEASAAPGELALPSDFVSTQVLAYQLALRSGRDAVRLAAVAERCRNRIGKPLHAVVTQDAGAEGTSSVVLTRQLQAVEEDLLERAWNSVLSQTKVKSMLSSGAYAELLARFEEIKDLAFTPENITGFLRGLNESAQQMRMKTVLDVFDMLTAFTSENVIWFMGWKSNDKQAFCGRRLRTSRIVLPGYTHLGGSGSVSADSLGMLHNLDLVMAMMDGSDDPSGGLVDTVLAHRAMLRGRQRVASKHFDIRFYPGVGTIHLFAHSQDLLDRLNHTVGQHRRWLPPQSARQTSNFWSAHKRAERFTRDVRSALGERSRVETILTSREYGSAAKAEALDKMSAVIENVARKWGIYDAIEQERHDALANTDADAHNDRNAPALTLV